MSPEELAKVDRERQKTVLEYARKLEQNPEKLRAAEQKKRDEEQRDNKRAVDDALRVYGIKMLGREVVSGSRPSCCRSRPGRTPGRRPARAR